MNKFQPKPVKRLAINKQIRRHTATKTTSDPARSDEIQQLDIIRYGVAGFRKWINYRKWIYIV